MNLLLLVLSFNINKSLSVQYVESAPIIDGKIEDLWTRADSAFKFVQFKPYEGDNPSDRTVVYLLQDNNNLYVAFRCYAENCPLTRQLSGNEDKVMLFLDPFASKTTAYYFGVSISGHRWDGWVLDDGRSTDGSWDGVWYCAVKVYEDRYEVEMKIPFKSICYKKGLSDWGINFQRYIASKKEQDYWVKFSQVEGTLVSKYGTLKGIQAKTPGYYFELFPEAFVRYDKTLDDTSIKPSASFNFKWDITSQMTLNATAYPDFAQIESDPFTLNLSRYPTHLDERRPFFLEGKEIFRTSDFGEHEGFYKPLEIFYSRSIGRSIDGEAVPIIAGLKFTAKSKNLNIGCFGAHTDEMTQTDSLIEPNRSFGVVRIKHTILHNSDIGLLASGSAVNRNDYNYALGIDGVYRAGINQLIIQTAMSDHNKKRGWAFSSGYFGIIKNFLTMGSVEVIQDSFDVQDIGFVPWIGMKKIIFLSGPYSSYQRGILNSLWLGAGVAMIQEPEMTSDWSKLLIFVLNPSLRNDWGSNISLQLGPYYEADTEYFNRSIDLSLWANGTRYHLSLGGNYGYSYNWYREFLSYQGTFWMDGDYNLLPRVELSLESNAWFEWDTTNTMIAITPRLTPRIEITITPDIKLEFFNEFVLLTPKKDINKTELNSNRLGFLISYNFRPKSWLYVAFNDHRSQDETNRLSLQNRVGAIKVKYLIYL
ncbi:hypothetical protein BXT86_01445 [candidate division WOR-3 bacterium 4484_100]|uniref:Uncharacterized protein n=1 Tax=candidate division WOR-3 bacterium 4484_100 TaxID=1936077 RepID=A0A1V4QGE1_UNCW3|nr:MAG: hypothetical protein BXT86_01445 [candidate division WOR-3 bacterium 4484_100]